MLVTLTLVFCLSANAAECQTVRPAAEDAWNGMPACMIRGQQLAALWLADHPKWALSRVRCTQGSPPRANDI
jgi:hypothetical protein